MGFDWKRAVTAVATGGLSEAARAVGKSDLLMGEKPSISDRPNLSPGQQALLDSLIEQMQGQVGQGVSPYEGKMFADPTQTNQNLFSMTNNMLSGDGQEQDIIDMMLNKYSGAYEERPFDPSATVDMFNTSVRNPAMKNFNNTVLPGIAEKYAGMNAGRSGAMNKMMLDAGSDLEGDLSGQLSQMLYNANEANAGREANKYLGMEGYSASVLPNVMNTAVNLPMNQINTALPVAQQEQTLAQQPLTEAYGKWQTEQDYNNPWLQYLNQLLGTQTTTPVVNPGTQGLLQMLMPAVGQAAGAYFGKVA